MKGPHFEQIKAAVLSEYATVGPTTIAARFGVTPNQVASLARRLKVTPTRKKPVVVTSAISEQIVARYEKEGHKILAEEFGLSRGCIGKTANRHGVATNVGHEDWGKIRAETNASVNIHFFDEWSEQMAWVLGFTFADGCVNKNMLALSYQVHSQDHDILEKIKIFTQAKTKVVCYPAGYQCGRNAGPRSHLTLSSQKLAQQLVELGCHPRKTYRNDPFPTVPKHFLPHFIRGAIDGDGSISRGRTVQKWIFNYCGSELFVKGFHDAIQAETNAFPQPTRKQKKQDCWYTTWTRYHDLLAIQKWLYPHPDVICGNRKKLLWSQMAEEYSKKKLKLFRRWHSHLLPPFPPSS